MGDMGEVFRDLRESTKQRKVIRMQDAESVTQYFQRHSQWHYSTHLPEPSDRPIHERRVDWWPSTSKWRFGNKNYYGNPEHLVAFLKKRGWVPIPRKA
jgi:hypothetical protein